MWGQDGQKNIVIDFQQRRALVAHCTRAGTSDFYRDLYGMPPGTPSYDVPTEEAWRALPFIGKDELLRKPFARRLFSPLSEVDYLRSTTGTTGKSVLFSPRTDLRHGEYRLQYHDFKNALLAYTIPAMPHWHEKLQRSLGYAPRVVVFDPKRARASVRLARSAGVDGMSLFAFHIPLVGKEMEREGMGARIRFIEICGEACTRSLYEYMRKTFPNATIIPLYGSTEAEDSPTGVPCRAIDGREPLALYHEKQSQYHELIEPETGALIEPRAGAEGELVVSAYAGEPSAFPLIRFRTDDIVRVVDAHCVEHGTWSFTVLGRTSLDFLRVAGGMLRADEIERVLRQFEQYVSDRFELHLTEETAGGVPKVRGLLYVDPKHDVDFDALARKIESMLRVGPSFTYQDGVTRGLYMPLVCGRLANTAEGKKQKRLIRD